MMKIVVISDSHGSEEYVYTVLYEEMYDAVIHLGDGESDLDFVLRELPKVQSKTLYRVRGNCDFFSALPTTIFENIGGHRFYITHGHMQHVKSGVSELYVSARDSGKDVALFGHTHIPFYEERDGIHLFNPGSLRQGYYGVITIDGDNISFEHKEL